MGEVIWTVIVTIGAVFGGIAVNMVSDEAFDYCERVTRILLKAAVNRLPAHAQIRYAEEWAAHLIESPGKLSRLVIATRIYFGALKLAALLPPTASPAQQAHLIDLTYRAKILARAAFDGVHPEVEGVFRKFGHTPEEVLNSCLAAYQRLADAAPVMDENKAAEIISKIETILAEGESSTVNMEKKRRT